MDYCHALLRGKTLSWNGSNPEQCRERLDLRERPARHCISKEESDIMEAHVREQ